MSGPAIDTGDLNFILLLTELIIELSSVSKAHQAHMVN
jgi:hypothetical protein